MTIKTLEYIHRLLREEYDRIDGAYQIARRNAYEAEEESAENVETLKEIQMGLFNERQEARRALEEFEDQDFR